MPISEDIETLNAFIQESQDHLDGIEDDLLSIEESGADIDEELVNKVFRAVHSIKGGAGFLGLGTVKELAHTSENVMGKIRSRELTPTPSIISTLLDAIDTLSTLINRYETSNDVDISSNLTALNAIYTGQDSSATPPQPPPAAAPTATAGKATTTGSPTDPYPSSGVALLKIAKTAIDAAFAKGSFVFMIHFTNLSTDSGATDKYLQETIAALKDTGEILTANINIEDDYVFDRLKETGNPLVLIFATIIEKDMLANFIGLDNEQVQQITPADMEQWTSSAVTPLKTQLPKIEKSVLNAAFDKGNFVFMVHYDQLSADNEVRRKYFQEAFTSIKNTGEILATNIKIEDDSPLEDLQESDNFFFVLIATILEKELLASFIGIDVEQIQQITPETIEQETSSPTIIPKQEQPDNTSTPTTSPETQATTKPNAAQTAPTPPPVKPPVKRSSPAKVESKPESLRVNVRLLDNLMTLAGELVLTRNQLVQAVSSRKVLGIDNISQRLNLVTSELQEAIMSTRMQPVGNVFNKFKRIVRDLSQNLGKKTDLIIKGEEVELDKTIIESISDPLTHLIRNSVDHGIEMPDQRIAAGKKETGTLRLTAYHEGGQVMIAIEDDGAGINIERVKEKVFSMGLRDAASLDELSPKEIAKLIFLPGMSTSQKVSDVSGRGVGMDVVMTNISKVGGTVDIDTTSGKGSLITIKLPLTLAIIPSLIISVHEERYAIPQVNLVELVRIPAALVKERVEKIGSALVMRLRGDLLPLIKLSDALDIDERYFPSIKTGEKLPDKRVRTEDRRQKPPEENRPQEDTDDNRRTVAMDRRTSPMSAYNILVVSAGEYHYGLIVDQLLDSEEIVVKPLGTHLRDCKCYAGASVQGDGKVALILDIVGISSVMNLRTVAKSVQEQALLKNDADIMQDVQSLLIAHNAPTEQIAIPLDLISRIELTRTENIEITGGQRNIQYRGGTLPLFSIDEVAKVGSPDTTRPNCYTIVFSIGGKEVGIVVSEIIDIIRGNFIIDEMTHKQPGIMGSAIILDEITLLVDLYGIIDNLMPEWTAALKSERQESSSTTILVVEDSPFFLNQLVTFLNEAGYQTLTATNGAEGLAVLAREKVNIVITDIEMPVMNGLEMVKKIRMDKKFTDLPIIAVTSLAGEAAEKQGRAAGINDYLVKLDREKIIASLKKHLERS